MTSTVLKGPREGFVENIKTNMSLLRRRVIRIIGESMALLLPAFFVAVRNSCKS